MNTQDASVTLPWWSRHPHFLLAGHLLLTSFAVICAALFSLTVSLIILPFSFGLLAALTGFEILVAFLQAFIFTILAAVYIGSSMHPEH